MPLNKGTNHGVVANALDYDIIVNKLYKPPLILPSYGLNSTVLLQEWLWH